EVGFGTSRVKPLQQRPRLTYEVGVERTGQAAVGSDKHYGCTRLQLRLAQEREPFRQLAGIQAGHHLAQRGRVRTSGAHAIHGALQLGRGNHLHRPRDLLRVLNGPYATLELATLSHDCSRRSSVVSLPSS